MALRALRAHPAPREALQVEAPELVRACRRELAALPATAGGAAGLHFADIAGRTGADRRRRAAGAAVKPEGAGPRPRRREDAGGRELRRALPPAGAVERGDALGEASVALVRLTTAQRMMNDD